MYIKKRIGVIRLFSRSWKGELLIVGTTSLSTFLYLEFLQPYVHVSVTVITGLTIAISFFIGFFTSQAYDRWWEARKIWGEFVNDSRSFGRMVTTLFRNVDGEPDVAEVQRRLIRRHIGYLYAVKERLRQESTQHYVEYLSDDDLSRVGSAANVGVALLQLQGEDLDAAERAGYVDIIKLAQLNDMLSRFSTSMGKAERTKTTVFPAYYASMIRVSLWFFLIVYPVALSKQVGYWAILYSVLLGMIFYLIYQAGQALLDPFEGTPHDTPMSSIVRTIEIDLLQQLGETEVPPPIQPVDGEYLM
jgi:putative membrane protein